MISCIAVFFNIPIHFQTQFPSCVPFFELVPLVLVLIDALTFFSCLLPTTSVLENDVNHKIVFNFRRICKYGQPDDCHQTFRLPSFYQFMTLPDFKKRVELTVSCKAIFVS